VTEQTSQTISFPSRKFKIWLCSCDSKITLPFRRRDLDLILQ
jgi:hypothetical protein